MNKPHQWDASEIPEQTIKNIGKMLFVNNFAAISDSKPGCLSARFVMHRPIYICASAVAGFLICGTYEPLQ